MPRTSNQFHVIKLINEALDKVRRQEQTSQPELKKSRYVWLKNKKRFMPSRFHCFSKKIAQIMCKTV